MPGTQVDIIVHNGTILTMNAERQIIEHGTIVIDKGLIVAIGDASLKTKFTANTTINAEGAIVMPGMINGHTHVPMTLFRGLGANAANIVSDVMFPLEKEFDTPDFVYWGTMLGGAEMLLGGITTFADMYYHEKQIAEACKKLGIRAVLGETIMKHPTPDSPMPYGGIEYARKFIEEYRGDPLITPALAPHAPYTVDGARLQELDKLAEELQVPLLMHVAEVAAEMEIGDAASKQGLSSIAYLKQLGVLNARWVYAHCNQANVQDIADLKASGAGVVHNPVSNLMCCLPVAPVYHMQQADLRLGMGTDGAMSGGTQDLISHFSSALLLQRVKLGNPTLMTPQAIVEMATIGGARALHMEKEIGSLEVGKKADVIIVNRVAPHNISDIDPYSALVNSTRPSDVHTSIINGKFVVARHLLVNVEWDDIKVNVEPIIERVKAWYKQHFPEQPKATTGEDLSPLTAGGDIAAGSTSSSIYNAANAERATQVESSGYIWSTVKAFVPGFNRQTAMAATVLGLGLVAKALIGCEDCKPWVDGP